MRRTIYQPFAPHRVLAPRAADAATETTTLPETATEEATEDMVEEAVEETVKAKVSDGGGNAGDGFRVILYDDDHHAVDEVASQIHKATQYPPLQCWAIMLEAHHKGRAICYRGSREKCHRVAKVLREIRLQCEVDCD